MIGAAAATALFGGLQTGEASAATPTCQGLAATVVGTAAADTINGTAGNDVIVGGGGADIINGANGNDTICGEDGNDTIRGGNGIDILDGGGGNDTLSGENGDDKAYGAAGDDRVDGANGNDTLYGGPNTDNLTGGQGVDACAEGETTLTCETVAPGAVAPTAAIIDPGATTLANGSIVSVMVTTGAGSGVLELRLDNSVVGTIPTSGSGTYAVEIDLAGKLSGGYLATARIMDAAAQSATSRGVVVGVETEPADGPTTTFALTNPMPLSQLGPLLHAANLHPIEYWHTIPVEVAPLALLPQGTRDLMAADAAEDPTEEHNTDFETEEINGGYIAGTTRLDDQLDSYQLAYEQMSPVGGEPQVFAVRVDGTYGAADVGALGQYISATEQAQAGAVVSGGALSTTGSGIVTPAPGVARVAPASTAPSALAAAADFPAGLDRAQWWPRYGHMDTYRQYEEGNIVGTCFGGLPCRKRATMLRARIQTSVTFKKTSLAGFAAGPDGGYSFAYEGDMKFQQNGNGRSGTKPACKGTKRFYAQRYNAVAGSTYLTNWPKRSGFYVDWDGTDSCSSEDLTLGVRYPDRSYVQSPKTEAHFYVNWNSPTSIGEDDKGHLLTIQPQSVERQTCNQYPGVESGKCVGIQTDFTRGVLVATDSPPETGKPYKITDFALPTFTIPTSCLDWSHRVTKLPPTPNIATQGCSFFGDG